ncbi:MAG: GGDEF domain-containing protein [Xanthomonadales bacterium]|nr:GGDEF domain-containing protein [Xanthomonadales bacterium]MCB1594204.1 GGDEF domain-containing protein [Xanthomonadales bacterium]
MKGTTYRIGLILLLCLFVFSNTSLAKIVGIPPYQTLKIPFSKEAQYFDMTVDEQGVLYVSYGQGVRIYNGAQWIDVEIKGGEFIRSVTQVDSVVYFGGKGFFGYITKDEYGDYGYQLIKEDFSSTDDIWSITDCHGRIFLGSLHHIFRYEPKSKSIREWSFDSRISGYGCVNDEMLFHHRDTNRILKYDNENWIDTNLNLISEKVVYEILQTGSNSAFLLADSDNWQVIRDWKIVDFEVGNQVPNLDNYVSIASIGEDQFVLGSNNGLLTFVNLTLGETETFQLTNEWISKIINTDSGLLVLAEYEVFLLEWPTNLRVQGKESGIASNLKNIYDWNHRQYILSSSGVFLKDEEQTLYQHKVYKRLDWTNKEAWDLFVLSDEKAILAESHKLFMVEYPDKITEISDTIYPRNFLPSEFHENLVFVTTEFDIRALSLKDIDFLSQYKIFDSRVTSLIELNSNTLLGSNDVNEVFVLNLIEKDGTFELHHSQQTLINIGLKTNSQSQYKFFKVGNEIFANNDDEFLQFSNGRFVKETSFQFDDAIKKDDIESIKETKQGIKFGYTTSDFFIQEASGEWKVVELRNYLRDSINFVKEINNEIKILSSGVVITYVDVPIGLENKANKVINLNAVRYKNNYQSTALSLRSAEIFGFEQGSGNISFDYSVSDVADKKFEYSYLLSGLDEKWSDYDKNTHLTFSRLPANDYVLKIRARKNEEIIESEIYQFKVFPHWYLTTSAKIIWVALSFFTLLALIKLLVRMKEKKYQSQRDYMQDVIKVRTEELRLANEKLTKVANEDALTGLYNRYFLDKYITEITSKEIHRLSVLLLDMDYFKKYNDKHGHVAGDKLLMRFASVIAAYVKSESGVAARYGGEEFVIIYVDKDLEFATKQALHISKAIEDKDNNVSVSIGIAVTDKKECLKHSDDIYNLIDNADKALYQAKAEGRNRINIYK